MDRDPLKQILDECSLNQIIWGVTKANEWSYCIRDKMNSCTEKKASLSINPAFQIRLEIEGE